MTSSVDWQKKISDTQTRIATARQRGDYYDVQQFSKQLQAYQVELQIALAHEEAKRQGVPSRQIMREQGLPGTQAVGQVSGAVYGEQQAQQLKTQGFIAPVIVPEVPKPAPVKSSSEMLTEIFTKQGKEVVESGGLITVTEPGGQQTVIAPSTTLGPQEVATIPKGAVYSPGFEAQLKTRELPTWPGTEAALGQSSAVPMFTPVLSKKEKGVVVGYADIKSQQTIPAASLASRQLQASLVSDQKASIEPAIVTEPTPGLLQSLGMSWEKVEAYASSSLKTNVALLPFVKGAAVGSSMLTKVSATLEKQALRSRAEVPKSFFGGVGYQMVATSSVVGGLGAATGAATLKSAYEKPVGTALQFGAAFGVGGAFGAGMRGFKALSTGGKVARATYSVARYPVKMATGGLLAVYGISEAEKFVAAPTYEAKGRVLSRVAIDLTGFGLGAKAVSKVLASPVWAKAKTVIKQEYGLTKAAMKADIQAAVVQTYAQTVPPKLNQQLMRGIDLSKGLVKSLPKQLRQVSANLYFDGLKTGVISPELNVGIVRAVDFLKAPKGTVQSVARKGVGEVKGLYETEVTPYVRGVKKFFEAEARADFQARQIIGQKVSRAAEIVRLRVEAVGRKRLVRLSSEQELEFLAGKGKLVYQKGIAGKAPIAGTLLPKGEGLPIVKAKIPPELLPKADYILGHEKGHVTIYKAKSVVGEDLAYKLSRLQDLKSPVVQWAQQKFYSLRSGVGYYRVMTPREFELLTKPSDLQRNIVLGKRVAKKQATYSFWEGVRAQQKAERKLAAARVPKLVRVITEPSGEWTKQVYTPLQWKRSILRRAGRQAIDRFDLLKVIPTKGQVERLSKVFKVEMKPVKVRKQKVVKPQPRPVTTFAKDVGVGRQQLILEPPKTRKAQMPTMRREQPETVFEPRQRPRLSPQERFVEQIGKSQERFAARVGGGQRFRALSGMAVFARLKSRAPTTLPIMNVGLLGEPKSTPIIGAGLRGEQFFDSRVRPEQVVIPRQEQRIRQGVEQGVQITEPIPVPKPPRPTDIIRPRRDRFQEYIREPTPRKEEKIKVGLPEWGWPKAKPVSRRGIKPLKVKPEYTPSVAGIGLGIRVSRKELVRVKRLGATGYGIRPIITDERPRRWKKIRI